MDAARENDNLKNKAPLSKLFKLTAFQMSQKLGYKNFSSKKALLTMLAKKTGAVVVFTFLIWAFFDKLVMGILRYEPKPYFIGFILAALMLFSFVFCISNIVTTLYFASDNVLLLSFPLSHNQVFLSKLLYLWFVELYKSITFYLPVLIAFGVCAKFSFVYYLCIPLIVAVASAIPIIISAAFSFPIMQLIKLIKRNSAIAMIFFSTVLVLLTMLILYFIEQLGIGGEIQFLGRYDTIYKSTVEFFTSVSKYSLFGMLLTNLIFGEKILLSLLIIIASIVAGVAIITFAVRPLYLSMAASGTEHKGNKISTKKNNKVNGTGLVSFVKKDFKILFRSPSLLFSFFLMILLMPYILVAANKFLGAIQVRETGDKIIFLANFLLIMLISMASNSYSATAISREGGNFYLTKTAPHSFREQAHAKVLVNLIISAAPITASCIIMIVLTKVNVIEGLLTLVTLLLLNTGHMLWSFQFDLENPKLDWYDTSEATSDSENSAKSILLALVLSAIFVIIFGAMLFLENRVYMWFKVIILSAAFAAARYYFVNIRLKYCFAKIEM